MSDCIKDKMRAIELVVRKEDENDSYCELSGIYRTVKYAVVRRGEVCSYIISQWGVVVAECTINTNVFPEPADLEALIESHINHH
jgi:hypothetical protein